MDDLAAALSGFGVTQTANDPSAPHPRYSLYKSKNVPDQHERRRRILESQKERRFNAKAHIRALNDNDWSGVDYAEDDDSMDTAEAKPKHPGRYYKNQLMLSEWMIEVPENFVDEWTMVACPIGRRCLVLSGQGYSSAYAKSGHYIIQSFRSNLPGGHKTRSRQGSAILDCIYSEAKRTFYILDMMAWNDMEVYNTDVEFRLFWLKAKLNEWEYDLTNICDTNEFKFVPLTFTSCDDAAIRRTIDEWSPEELDGLLFYHKRVHYLFGANPLCLWLQAYMLPDILDIQVSPGHMQRAPSDYVNFQHHAEQVGEKKAKMEEKQRQRQEKWDAEQKAKMDDEVVSPEIESVEMEHGVVPKKGRNKKGGKKKNGMETEITPTDEVIQND